MHFNFETESKLKELNVATLVQYNQVLILTAATTRKSDELNKPLFRMCQRFAIINWIACQ